MRPLEEVDACLKEHLKYPAFRGLRYAVCNDPSGKFHNSHRDKNAYENERMLRAMPLFERYDISLELWCYSHQIRDAAAFAAKFPKVRMILDHFGGPLDLGYDEHKFQAWADAMIVLAKQPNVYAKLSGLMAHLGLNYHTKKGGVDRWTIANGPFGRLIEYTVRVFGVDRCIWASNFPVGESRPPLAHSPPRRFRYLPYRPGRQGKRKCRRDHSRQHDRFQADGVELRRQAQNIPHERTQVLQDFAVGWKALIGINSVRSDRRGAWFARPRKARQTSN